MRTMQLNLARPTAVLVPHRRPTTTQRTLDVATRYQPDDRAPQSTTQRIDELVIQDHNKVRQLNHQFRKTQDPDEREKLAYLIVRELSMHSAKEEEVLYPAITKAFGQAETDELLKCHTIGKERMDELSHMDPRSEGGAAFDAQMASIMTEFNHHSTDEERRVLPKLLQAPGVDPVVLGRAFAEAGKHAVTRPHPWAPDKPPLNFITNRLALPLDAFADMYRFGGKAPDVEAAAGSCPAPTGTESPTTQDSGGTAGSSPPA